MAFPRSFSSIINPLSPPHLKTRDVVKNLTGWDAQVYQHEMDHLDGIAEKFSQDDKIGRNDPCKCGSGKKYKKCCGK